MLRWIAVLTALCLLTALLAVGIVPTRAAGLARTLCAIYAGLLAASIVIALLRRA